MGLSIISGLIAARAVRRKNPSPACARSKVVAAFARDSAVDVVVAHLLKS